MYTRCPRCKTVFEASPEDLDAQEGLVRCGECDEVFHVLDNEIDQEEITLGGSFADSINRILDESEAREDEQREEAGFDDFAENNLDEIELKRSSANGPDPDIYRRPLSRNEYGYQDVDESEIELEKEELPPAPVTAGFTDVTNNRQVSDLQAELNLTDSIGAHAATRGIPRQSSDRQSRGGIISGIVLAALLALLTVQAAVHVKSIRTNPALRPTLETICGVLGCSGVLQRDIQLVTISSSNKIDTAPGEFTLSATIENTAAFEVKLPDLEVTLTNSFQMMIGRRTFTPKQYLVDNTLADNGFIAPGQEVEARLPLISDGLKVSGFELHLRNPE